MAAVLQWAILVVPVVSNLQVNASLSLGDRGLDAGGSVRAKRQNTATRKWCPLCNLRLFPVVATGCGKYHQHCASVQIDQKPTNFHRGGEECRAFLSTTKPPRLLTHHPNRGGEGINPRHVHTVHTTVLKGGW